VPRTTACLLSLSVLFSGNHISSNLFVESVESVVILLGNSTRKSSYASEVQHVKLFEGIPVSVSCTASGGYPPPQVTIRIGNDDITHIFETVVNQTLLPGNGHGLRYVKYETHLWTRRYVPHADANQQVLRCSAEVTGLQVVIQQIQLNICCKSLIFVFLYMSYHESHYLISKFAMINRGMLLFLRTCTQCAWDKFSPDVYMKKSQICFFLTAKLTESTLRFQRQ